MSQKELSVTIDVDNAHIRNLAAGSKRGFGPGEGRQRIQVIFNGKISTPQSLVPSKANTDSSGNNGCIQTTRPSDALLDEISKRKNITQKRYARDRIKAI